MSYDPSDPGLNLCDDHAQVKPCRFCKELDDAWDRANGFPTETPTDSLTVDVNPRMIRS